MVGTPQILKPTHSTIVRVADHLLNGGVAVVPTETVYGLAGVYKNTVAHGLIYKIKKRPPDNPLICHVDGLEMADDFLNTSDVAKRLAKDFWPGPLTMILHSRGNQETVAVRSPDHPVIKDLFRELKKPFVAPSANPSGYVSPTKAQHVYMDFLNNPNVDNLLIIDGGNCDRGVESTIVDLTRGVPTIVRPGVIRRSCLEKSIGFIENKVSFSQINSPGTSSKHYSPRQPTVFVKKIPQGINYNEVAIIGEEAEACYSLGWPQTPREAEQVLYSALRKADESGAKKIFIVHPPTGDGWGAIWDRLFRATRG